MPPLQCTCVSSLAHEGRRVVLTGGPGAGKTAVLEVVRKQLCPHVAVLPEAASIVFGGGFPRRDPPAARRAAQLAIYHVQAQLEALAASEDSHAVVLCDRGVLDGLAYWPGDAEDFFRAVGQPRAALLARYSAVLHLRTPPASGGYNHENPLRIETAADAAAVDARIVAAWEGHPRRFFIESTPDFLQKLAQTLARLREEVPPCCRVHFASPGEAAAR